MNDEYVNLKVKISIKSSIITPLHSDTIFGHICWGYYYKYGESDFLEFLKSFDNGKPPLILSNGFPENYLPMPILAPIDKYLYSPNPNSKISNLSEYKKFTKIKFVKNSIFKELNKIGFKENILFEHCKDDLTEIMVTEEFLHTSIDRNTSTALEGQLYQQEETFYKNNTVFDLYCKIFYPMTKEKLKQCFEYINETGYGKDKTTGKGRVEFKISEEIIDFQIENANAYMVISNYIPAKADPTEGYYDIFTKYGKLGGHFANSPHDDSDIIKPFKKPVVMIKPGSTFMANNIKEFYGRVIDNLKTKDGFIKHYGISYPVPVYIGD